MSMLKAPKKWNVYSMRFGMALVNEKAEIVHTPVTCRDYLHDIVRTAVYKRRSLWDSHPYNPRSGDKKVCMDRLRLLLILNPFRDGDGYERMAHAINVLNKKEEYAGMQLSTWTPVQAEKVPNSMKCHHMFLIEGSDEYMKNPHLLSALTLVLRFCIMNKPFNYVEVGDLTEAYKALRASQGSFQDAYLMTDCHPWIHVIMKDRHEIFGGLRLKDLYSMKAKGDFHTRGGIQSLCRGVTNNPKVDKRMKKLKQAYGQK